MSGVRRATSDDAQGIAAVIRDAWGSTMLPDVCQAQLEDDRCLLLVAEEAGIVTGFASAFLTVGAASERRWEVDLVAVRTIHQGKGLGSRLIRGACQDGTRLGTAVARAVIRVDHLQSQRAFEKADFASDRQIHQLLLWSPEAGENAASCPTGVTLVPVDTLTYRGLWIEGLEDLAEREQHFAVAAARAVAKRDGRSTVGALVPSSGEHLLAAKLRARARACRQFFWFIRPILATRPSGKHRCQAGNAKRARGT